MRKKIVVTFILIMSIFSVILFNGFSGGITSISSLKSNPAKYNNCIVSVPGTIAPVYVKIPKGVIKLVKKAVPNININNLSFFRLKGKDDEDILVLGISIPQDKIAVGKHIIVTGKFINVDIKIRNIPIIISKSVVPSNIVVNKVFPFIYPVAIGLIILLIGFFIFILKRRKYYGHQLSTNQESNDVDDTFFEDEEDIDDEE